MRILTSLLSVVFLVGVVSCDDDDIDDVIDDDDVTQPPLDEGTALGNELASQIATDFAGVSDAMAIAMSAQIMVTIDEGEIMLAQRAQERANEDTVLDFADEMVSEHSAHIELVNAFLNARGIVAQDSRIAVALREDAQRELAALDAAVAFDFEYMSSQVRMHQAAFIIVGELIEQNRDEEFRSLLSNTQDTIDAHRVEAEDILESLAP